MASVLTIFSKSFLTLKSVDIGRLITNVGDPGQEFWPRSTPAVANEYIDVLPYKDVNIILGSEQYTMHRGWLTRFFFRSRSQSNKIDRSPHHVRMERIFTLAAI